ncbi:MULTISPECIES: glycosyltransferase family 2 protein [Leuconostoc gelidum group]|uniref:Glycosyltransferase family 2 protein n=1 Tax=Leuconostoc gelidum subsp. gelidum TaxID=1607839 RepID=A0AB35G1L2_LEUGE|nr:MULTISPECIES: glycosyltransferase family 2 protein [Leuconostoc gelidum group]MBZ5960316.1 glycosyltransferase family 2 protein [Leuconostoc gasicomitatum]MBZ5968821.1 glycosyltransferase family 2 protein [Leuconostoc gasicomitatum]MBZ6016782.1 glycosyltransferase family 2 protein [Leuconostoc gelidum subsp. gelidum]
MTEKTVTAAIVTYNRLELLKESLAAILAQTKYLSHVIIVNNMSTDGTTEYLDSLNDERIVVYHATENLGGAGGFNQAVRLFGEQLQDDFVWLMDDDTIPEPDALSHLVAFTLDHPEVGFVNSQVRWGSIDGNPSWMNVTAPRAFTWQRYLIDTEEPAVEVVNSTFVSVMFSREMVAMVGLPQKEYFIWGDDMEYTNRIADIKRGYMVMNSIAVHKSKENTKPGDIVAEKDDSRLWRYNYEYRNRVLTARRISKKEMIKVVLVAIVRDWRKTLLKKEVSFRGKKLGVILRGLWRGLFFKPAIEYAAGLKTLKTQSLRDAEMDLLD